MQDKKTCLHKPKINKAVIIVLLHKAHCFLTQHK